MTIVVHKLEGSIYRGLRAVLSNTAAFFSTVAAATAVSAAIENRRQPLEADLRQLGMAGAKFNLNY
jgi:hypothetical protein